MNIASKVFLVLTMTNMGMAHGASEAVRNMSPEKKELQDRLWIALNSYKPSQFMPLLTECAQNHPDLLTAKYGKYEQTPLHLVAVADDNEKSFTWLVNFFVTQEQYDALNPVDKNQETPLFHLIAMLPYKGADFLPNTEAYLHVAKWFISELGQHNRQALNHKHITPRFEHGRFVTETALSRVTTTCSERYAETTGRLNLMVPLLKNGAIPTVQEFQERPVLKKALMNLL